MGFALLSLHRFGEALVPLRAVETQARGFMLCETFIYLCEQAGAQRLSNDAVDHLLLLQQVMDAGRIEEEVGIALSEQAVLHIPDCALSHFFLGKALLQADRHRSEDALRRCLELNPDDTTAINALGHIGLHRLAAGDPVAARHVWADALERFKANPHIALIALVHAGEFGAA